MGPFCYSVVNRHYYCSRKGKNDAEGDCGLPLPAQPRSKAASAKGGPASLVSVDQNDPGECLRCGQSSELCGQDHPRQPKLQAAVQSHGSDATTPLGLDGRALSQRGSFSSLKTSGDLPCWVWDLLGTHQPFLPSRFSLLDCDYVSYAGPTVIFWKHITCLISQVLS